MSTNNIVPSFSPDSVTPSNYVEQSSQNPAPSQPAVAAQPAAPQQPQPSAPAAQPSSRLGAILGAVAKTVSTGLAGIPDKGRPSFVTGLGEGSRAAQQAEATAQAVKFATFNDQVRAANLHNQDLQKQAADDAQTKAQQAAEDFQNEYLGKAGGSIDTHPNDGTAVMQTLQAQTAANGAASIAPGTHVSADGKNINVPANTPETLAAQVQNYKALEGKLPGLPGLPAFDPSSVKGSQDVTNARAALGQHLDIMQHLLQGYKADGSVYSHQELNNMIPAYQAQIDSLTKNGGASEYQIGTLKNTLAILQANEKHHSDTEDAVAAKVAQQKAQQAGAVANAQLPAKQALQDNAAGNKTQKIDSTSVVAFDPDAPGLNGTKGANVVLPKAQADAKGLYSYKANPEKINGLIAGVNDVQTKINALADASADMSEVDPSVSATMSGSGIGLEWHGVGLGSLADIANSQGRVLANKGMNDATRNYIVALAGAHEAITQLPRLQTMGASSRVTEKQMEQAAKMLPTPGDDTDMANAKLHGLQNTIDPIRKQIPSMPGASLVPSFRENGGSNWSRTQRLQQTPAAKTPTKAAGAFNYADTM